MANEATVRTSLQIRSGHLFYNSQPSGFVADVVGLKGPVPGAFTVPVGGVACDLSQLDSPGLCRIMNLDPDNYVLVGMRDPTLDIFLPMMEILPGESYVLRLWRSIGEEFEGTGTGTTASTQQLFLMADTEPLVVVVEAFER